MTSRNGSIRLFILCFGALLAAGLLCIQVSSAAEKLIVRPTKPAQVSIKSVAVSTMPGKPGVVGAAAMPGTTLNITGSGFTSTKGTVVLKGLSVPSGPASSMNLNVTKWTDSVISAQIPRKGGLLDSNATLVITRTDGKKLTHPIKFAALKETMTLPIEVIYQPILVCRPEPADPAHCTDICSARREGSSTLLEGIHECSNLPHQGTDIFGTMPLINGWVINDVSNFVVIAGTARTHIAGGGHNQPSMTGEVFWSTAPSQGKHIAKWHWTITVTGPVGVPYK